MTIDEPVIQPVARPIDLRDEGPRIRHTPWLRLGDRVFRRRAAEPLTHEEHRRRRLLEIARREREAEMLRHTAMWILPHG